MPRPKNQRDEFAEQYIAGVLADAGWSVYFPRKDKGFDFIISKKTADGMVIRPVQVKGKFPETVTAIRKQYGYRGELTALHEEMVLVLPLFTAIKRLAYPDCVAYMPFSQISQRKSGIFSCEPAKLEVGKVMPKETYQKYFDEAGIKALEKKDWN